LEEKPFLAKIQKIILNYILKEKLKEFIIIINKQIFINLDNNFLLKIYINQFIDINKKI
jgi:hypothetical protein